jgi:hypothetical protein
VVQQAIRSEEEQMPHTDNDTPYAADSDTSLEAAENAEHTSKASDEQRIYDFISGRGSSGATCDEVEAWFASYCGGIAHQTASARINGLEKKGRIWRTTETRKTRRGCKASVYVSELVKKSEPFRLVP